MVLHPLVNLFSLTEKPHAQKPSVGHPQNQNRDLGHPALLIGEEDQKVNQERHPALYSARRGGDVSFPLPVPQAPSFGRSPAREALTGSAAPKRTPQCATWCSCANFSKSVGS